jgi:hypothetical protein
MLRSHGTESIFKYNNSQRTRRKISPQDPSDDVSTTQIIYGQIRWEDEYAKRFEEEQATAYLKILSGNTCEESVRNINH